MNNHKGTLLVALTMLGDVAISSLLFSLFFKECNIAGEQTQVVLTLIYFIIVYNGGVILYKRNTRDFQVPMLVLRNIIIYVIAYFILAAIDVFHLLPLRHSALYFLSVLLCSSAYRITLRGLCKAYRLADRNSHHVVFVGCTANIRNLYYEMTGTPSLGYRVDGYFDYKEDEQFSKECMYLGTPDNVMTYLSQHRNVHELYCCLPSNEKDVILHIIHYCVNNLVHFYSVPNITNYFQHRMYFNVLGSVPYLSLFRDPLTRSENRFIKRTFDIVFSLTFLCTLFPIILILVTIITKITMPGPVFFRQKRNGLNDKEFYCLKFRSMKVNDDADRLQATKDDPRTTKWGNIMRKTNIDELPQFINVLLGDMSVVGPRPHMVLHTEEYSKKIDMYMVRHFVKPGITGWSQITGFRGETKELSQMEGRIKGDIWYIEHWSFWLDIYIIIKTVINGFRGDKNAY